MFRIQRSQKLGAVNDVNSLRRLACTYIAVLAMSSTLAGASASLGAVRLAAEDHYTTWDSDEHLVTVEVAVSGYLLIDVAASHTAESNLFIDFEDTPASVEILERAASAWLIAVRQPETVNFLIDSMDPRHEPGAFEVRTDFLEDPELGYREGRVEPRASADVLKQLCGGGGSAVRNLLCAKPLAAEEELTVELRGTEVRSFDLQRWQTVEISTRGELDTHGAIYDESGLLVAADDDSGTLGNFRIFQTLPPGRYFLRLAQGEEGPGKAVLQLKPRGQEKQDIEFILYDQEEDQDLVEGEPD